MVIFGSFALSVGGRAAPGPWGAARALSAGVQERQAARPVQLEQVVDRALQSPLGAGCWLAADQDPAAVLDGADLAEHRLDDRLAPTVELAAPLSSGLARHPLLGGGVLGESVRAALAPAALSA